MSELYYVDACNLVHAWPQLRQALRGAGLQTALTHLDDRLQPLASTATRAVLVIDSRVAARPERERRSGAVQWQYTAVGQTADAWIEQALAAMPRPEIASVVTADQALAQSSHTLGASALSPPAFEALLVGARATSLERERHHRRSGRAAPLQSLGEHLGDWEQA